MSNLLFEVRDDSIDLARQLPSENRLRERWRIFTNIGATGHDVYFGFMAPGLEPSQRLRRALWASVAFLAGFSVLIVIVANYFLLPATSAVPAADVEGKRQLSAVSALLLAILLFIMVVGLLMTFRIRRFFLPNESATRSSTQHIDAWAESGRRMTAPPDDDDDEDDVD